MVRLVKLVLFERLAKRHFDVMSMFFLANDHQRYIDACVVMLSVSFCILMPNDIIPGRNVLWTIPIHY